MRRVRSKVVRVFPAALTSVPFAVVSGLILAVLAWGNTVSFNWKAGNQEEAGVAMQRNRLWVRIVGDALDRRLCLPTYNRDWRRRSHATCDRRKVGERSAGFWSVF